MADKEGVTASPEPRLLEWKHYKKIPSSPAGKPWDAHTAPSYDIPPNWMWKKVGGQYQIDKLLIQITPSPSDMWVVTGKESVQLLSHERGHWKLDIIVGKEMHKAMMGIRAASLDALKKEFVEEFDWHRKKREDFLSKQYDADTKHGTEPKKQKEWDLKIEGWFAKGECSLTGPA
jgi:hypothetical protein